MDSITKFNPEDYSQLVEKWLKAEQKGEQFPVDFDLAWKIAGYARKDIAKRKLSKLEKDIDFSAEEWKNGQRGRSSELIRLTCDAFKHFCLIKHFCLMAETEQGKQVRQYFIEAEKKWKLVEERHPEVASEIEIIKAQTELAREQRLAIEHSRMLFEQRQVVVSLHGASMLALLDGRPEAVVEKIEKVTETVVCKDGQTVSFTGKSLAQTAKELGFKTGKELERWLESIGHDDLICQGMRAVQSPYIPQENLQTLKHLFAEYRRKSGRQMLLGE